MGTDLRRSKHVHTGEYVNAACRGARAVEEYDCALCPASVVLLHAARLQRHGYSRAKSVTSGELRGCVRRLQLRGRLLRRVHERLLLAGAALDRVRHGTVVRPFLRVSQVRFRMFASTRSYLSACTAGKLTLTARMREWEW